MFLTYCRETWSVPVNRLDIIVTVALSIRKEILQITTVLNVGLGIILQDDRFKDLISERLGIQLALGVEEIVYIGIGLGGVVGSSEGVEGSPA
jgi:hypothetical protein